MKKNRFFYFHIRRFPVRLPDELVRQVVDKVKNLIPVMLDAARPEEEDAQKLIFLFYFIFN